ncbi:MAG: hypothetical protein C3L25_06420 [Candidatus Sedimenticola endophacoides]|nr:MAG: hypothetical protein C3L25_06420 [Candidatus Sedimenticola endophacoides]
MTEINFPTMCALLTMSYMMNKEGELHSNAYGVGIVTAGDSARGAIDHAVITEEHFAAVICLAVALSEGLDPWKTSMDGSGIALRVPIPGTSDVERHFARRMVSAPCVVSCLRLATAR